MVSLRVTFKCHKSMNFIAFSLGQAFELLSELDGSNIASIRIRLNS